MWLICDTILIFRSSACPESGRQAYKQYLAHQTLGQWDNRLIDPVTWQMLLKNVILNVAVLGSLQKLHLYFLAFDHVRTLLSLYFLCSSFSIFLTTYPPLNANISCEGSLTKPEKAGKNYRIQIMGKDSVAY